MLNQRNVYRAVLANWRVPLNMTGVPPQAARVNVLQFEQEGISVPLMCLRCDTAACEGLRVERSNTMRPPEHW